MRKSTHPPGPQPRYHKAEYTCLFRPKTILPTSLITRSARKRSLLPQALVPQPEPIPVQTKPVVPEDKADLGVLDSLITTDKAKHILLGFFGYLVDRMAVGLNRQVYSALGYRGCGPGGWVDFLTEAEREAFQALRIAYSVWAPRLGEI